MKKIKELLRRIGTAGLAAIMLTAQMPVTAFAEEIAQPQEIVVSDEVLPAEVQMEDVLPGESGGGIKEGINSFPAFSESKSIDGVRITVEEDEGVFPEGAVLSVETNGDTATAETDGFSLYTVEFTYENKQYVCRDRPAEPYL